MISPRGIDHLVLRIVDLERMLRFYCDGLGCTVERRRDDIGLIQLRAGNALIDLVPVDGAIGKSGGAPPGTEGRNLDHFCLRIQPFDETGIRHHLVSLGYEPGPLERRYGAEGDGPSIYVSDPEGNTVELKGPPNREHPMKGTHTRIARPTDNLEAVVGFYRDGLGLEVLSGFEDHEGFDGVMLGHPGEQIHFEFTHQRGHTVGRAPTHDNLIVFYLPDSAAWKATIERMRSQGHEPVASYNPYWDQQGVTFEDPDGYRVVLQNASWP